MSELGKRILTACVLAPLAIWWLMFAQAPWFELMLGILGIAAMFELLLMLALPWWQLYVFSGAIGLAMLLLSQQAAAIILLLGVIWTGIFVLAARAGRDKQESLPIGDQTLRFGLGYWLSIWLLLFVWVLDLLHRLPYGRWFILGAFVGVWAADIGAYFGGRSFGRHKLCPLISPGKTVEGALAGGLCGIAAATWIWVSFAKLGLIAALGIALLLVISAILGDLGESAVKRAVGAKDSGRLLPGHGGLLDRIDALIPAVSVAGVLHMNLVWAPIPGLLAS